MEPVQIQTITPHTFSNPHTVLRMSPRNSTPVPRTTRTSKKTLLSHSPQIPTAHPDIKLHLLRNKLLLTCRQYVASSIVADALVDGIYSRAEHWITPSSQAASKFGKSKRYYVLETSTFTFQGAASAWEARVESGGSQPIDAGNGVVIFVKERKEWDAFLKGYRRQGKRAGQLLKLKQKETEKVWKDQWRKKCGMPEGEAKREVNAGPMWVLVKSAVLRIVKGEA
ncbi:hypothetical protein IQ07DRAFT_347096 [Pyrenochaeta sp. DS3sAY3a]|nr:hypothetical protein IQ07DRAFT_347096 [Pyrenochaeta sp. DS3sAY3a]